MDAQKGKFNGIEACSLDNIGCFNMTSRLLSEFEHNSIFNQKETNKLLIKIVFQKFLIQGDVMHKQA